MIKSSEDRELSLLSLGVLNGYSHDNSRHGQDQAKKNRVATPLGQCHCVFVDA
jgi:hypothetical protein